MTDYLKAAKNTHQFLLAVCGLYLLGRLQFGPEGTDPATVSFLGFAMPNLGYFALIIGATMFLGLLRLYAYLEQLPIKEQGIEYYRALQAVPWILISRRGRAAGWVNMVEGGALFFVLGDIFNTLKLGSMVAALIFGLPTFALLGLCYWRFFWMAWHLERTLNRSNEGAFLREES